MLPAEQLLTTGESLLTDKLVETTRGRCYKPSDRREVAGLEARLTKLDRESSRWPHIQNNSPKGVVFMERATGIEPAL